MELSFAAGRRKMTARGIRTSLDYRFETGMIM